MVSATVPLYVLDVGAVVTKRGGRLLVARDGAVLTSAPVMRLSEVVLFGSIGVTTPALLELLKHGIPVVFLRGDGRARGRLEPIGSPHVQLRQQQLTRSADPAARLALSRAVVAGKIHNQRALLTRRARPSRRSPQRAELRRVIELLDGYERMAPAAVSVQRLVGLEGAATRAYFRALRALLPAETGFPRRERHAPDVVNALLNYCSALLREYVIGAIAAAGLDPYVSFLHEPMRTRPTLAFDLMEEWRPVLLEAIVLALLGLGTVTSADLHVTGDGPRLTPEACAATIRRFRERLDAPAPGVRPHGAGEQPSGGLSYGARIHRQARLLRDWIRGQADYEAFRWR